MAGAAEIHNYYIHAPNQPDGPLRLPRRIAADALERIPESYRIAYIEEDDGRGYFLSTRTADVVRDSEAEIARLNAVIEELPAKLERERKAWRDDAVNAAIQSSLKKAGVKEGLLEGAAAILKKKNQFEVDPSDDGKGLVVTARNAHGLCEVDRLAMQLVDGEKGAVWRDSRSAPFAGINGGRRR